MKLIQFNKQLYKKANKKTVHKRNLDRKKGAHWYSHCFLLSITRFKTTDRASGIYFGKAPWTDRSYYHKLGRFGRV